MTLKMVLEAAKAGYVAGINQRHIPEEDRNVALYFMCDRIKASDALYLAFEGAYMGALECNQWEEPQ